MARPEFTPTAAQRHQVTIAAGAGLQHSVIAAALGVSRNTLEKRFATELTVGACARRIDILLAMFAAGQRGNVTAQKAYLKKRPGRF
jgi:hypothetical protein